MLPFAIRTASLHIVTLVFLEKQKLQHYIYTLIIIIYYSYEDRERHG